MDRQDDDLDELLSDLSTTLSELQETLADEQSESRPQPRSRRLPSPGRFLRFTEEHTIPTLISLLETHIRALELLQGLLRLVNGREERSGASRQAGENRRVRKTGRRTLDALDGALSDLQGALEGEPPDDDARSLLNDARSLSDEIDERLSRPNGTDATEDDGPSTNNTEDEPSTDDRSTTDGAIRIDVEGPDSEHDADAEDGVSVDAELDTIKQELQDEENDEGSDEE